VHQEIDWILFDADHTLFDFDRSSRRALQLTLEEHGVDHHPSHFDTYDVFNKQCWQAYEQGHIDRSTLVLTRFQLFFNEIQETQLDALAFNKKYLSKLPELPYFIPGAPELIKHLVHHFSLGIITNGLKEVQRPRLEATGLDAHFKVIVVSGEIGLAKPDPAYFDFVHEQMERPDKARVLVVGDSLYSDIGGGSNYGFRTCWYNPGGEPDDPDGSAEFVVKSYEDLLMLLNL